MPAKNTIKVYKTNGYYHIYNRGVDKRTIFLDDQDYKYFLELLKQYLSPPEQLLAEQAHSPFKEKPSRTKHRIAMNLHSKLSLLSYCLMPNHIHLLVHQSEPHAIAELMRRVGTSYSTYFNRRYHRSGTLFQGVYKAATIETDWQLLFVSRAIHLNPIQTKRVGLLSTTSGNPNDYPYSSYEHYNPKAKLDWLDAGLILTIFEKTKSELPKTYNSYFDFIEDMRLNTQEIASNLLFDDE